MGDNGTSAPGAQPPFKEITANRLKLLANGYSVLPIAGKKAVYNDWNRARTMAALQGHKAPAIVSAWQHREDALGTGVRIVNRLVAIDIDVDCQLAYAIRDAIEDIVPGLLDTVPTRFAFSKFKMALFCRLAPGSKTWRRISTFKYRDGEKSHQVEIFGDELSPHGDCRRQFAVDGPHPDGGEYYFVGGFSLLETKPEQLPEITFDQAHAILTRAEAIMAEAGMQLVANSRVVNGEALYDITEETRIKIENGPEVDYAGLCDAFEARSPHDATQLRCSTSFLPGRDGNRDDHCIVGVDNRHRKVGIYVFGDDLLHFPVWLKPTEASEVTATLATAIEQGMLPEPPAPPPAFALTEKGQIKLCMANARLAIEADGLLCRHDVFHNRTWIEGPAGARWIGEVNDTRIRALRMRLSSLFRVDFGDRHTNDAVLDLADENKFNPVLDMLAEAQANWDGVPRIDRMADEIFRCGRGKYAACAIRKTMIAAVRRVRSPGCKFDTMPLFISPQGWDKSTAWRILAGDENFSEAQIIGANAREVMEGLAGVWIHENAELAGMAKRDVEVVKDYCSRQVDRARPAYGRHVESLPRHSIEIGTTNEETPLLDTSGNRRFWPLMVKAPVDTERLRRERLQYWGEAAAIEATGESLVLDRKLWAEAGKAQEAARLKDPWEDILVNLRVLPAPRDGSPVSGLGEFEMNLIHTTRAGLEVVFTESLYRHALGLKDARNLLNPHIGKRLAGVMRALGWRRADVEIGTRRGRGYSRAAKSTTVVQFKRPSVGSSVDKKPD